tara:strand:- start:468 stop:824 length:357 start_codon:yes stop_codon:yes gene_type:complete
MATVLETLRSGMDGFNWVDLLQDLGLDEYRATIGAKMLRGVYPNRKAFWETFSPSIGDDMLIVGVVDMLSELAVAPGDNVLTVEQAKAALQAAEEREKALATHKATGKADSKATGKVA